MKLLLQYRMNFSASPAASTTSSVNWRSLTPRGQAPDPVGDHPDRALDLQVTRGVVVGLDDHGQEPAVDVPPGDGAQRGPQGLRLHLTLLHPRIPGDLHPEVAIGEGEAHEHTGIGSGDVAVLPGRLRLHHPPRAGQDSQEADVRDRGRAGPSPVSRLNRVSFSGKNADGFSSSRGLASSSRAGPCPDFFTDSKRVSGKVCSMKARNSMHRVISSVMMCRSWSLSIPAPTGWPLCAPTMIRSPNVARSPAAVSPVARRFQSSRSCARSSAGAAAPGGARVTAARREAVADGDRDVAALGVEDNGLVGSDGVAHG